MGMPAATTRYTLEDLERFPDDGNRYELLHGELFVTPAPRSGHEYVIMELLHALMPALSVPGLALVYTRGAVTRRPGTQFEPDLLVLPPRYRGDPDWVDVTERWLVVEVQSPSTRKLDATVKRTAYFDLGVQQLWLVDPRDRTVEVCTSRTESTIVTDTIRWQVPTVGIVVTIDVAKLFGER